MNEQTHKVTHRLIKLKFFFYFYGRTPILFIHTLSLKHFKVLCLLNILRNVVINVVINVKRKSQHECITLR